MEFNTDNVEQFIVKSLLNSPSYARQFIDKLTPNIFSEKYKGIIAGIAAYYRKAYQIPSCIILEQMILPKVYKGDQEKIDAAIQEIENINTIQVDQSEMNQFLAEETKKFVKNRRVMNAIGQVVDLLGSNEDHEKIVSILDDAYRINFDDSLGIEYFEDLEGRLQRSQATTRPISTGLPKFDEFIGGGYRRKALFLFAAPSNGGKSIFLNNAAVDMVLAGYNVVYVTLELPEDYMAQRTDAKFAGISMNTINADPQEAIRKVITKRDYIRKQGKKLGAFYYKEYSPNSVSCLDLRALLKNLEVKKGFKPDFIIVDYLKLLKPVGKVYGDNLYSKLCTVSEELRSLAFEYDACVLSASQTGRQSYGSATIGMEHIADSIGVVQSCDVMVSIATNETLHKESLVVINIAKSRFSKNNQTLMMKLDTEYMRLVEVEDTRNKPDPREKLVKTEKAASKKDSSNGGDFADLDIKPEL